GINPYALGFAMFQDIKRICQSPTDEDKYWFPDIAGSDWLETLHFAMRDFKDESFISQFLSPKVMRDFRSSRYLMMTGIIIWRSPPFITKKVIGRFDQNCRHSIT
ncbi:SpoVR family protein, partial [Salmonella enterica subsp. enterica serovar Gaminara str. ATCC BAA-711]